MSSSRRERAKRGRFAYLASAVVSEPSRFVDSSGREGKAGTLRVLGLGRGKRTVSVCELFEEREGKAGTLRVLGLGRGKRTVPVCGLFGERGQSGDASRT
ncbi:MAG TPA: hypothetical protein VE860_22315, partial [Chthoniobacterales bacterium]|nr:hypothetical protein [Chthoniobacterales bacterium]